MQCDPNKKKFDTMTLYCSLDTVQIYHTTVLWQRSSYTHTKDEKLFTERKTHTFFKQYMKSRISFYDQSRFPVVLYRRSSNKIKTTTTTSVLHSEAIRVECRFLLMC